jgi:hypothetical protein
MQEMRDERKGLRQQLKERLGVPEEELNRIAPSLDAPYAGSGFPSSNLDFENDPSTTNLYVCNLPADVTPKYYSHRLNDKFRQKWKTYLKHTEHLARWHLQKCSTQNQMKSDIGAPLAVL